MADPANISGAHWMDEILQKRSEHADIKFPADCLNFAYNKGATPPSENCKPDFIHICASWSSSVASSPTAEFQPCLAIAWHKSPLADLGSDCDLYFAGPLETSIFDPDCIGSPNGVKPRLSFWVIIASGSKFAIGYAEPDRDASDHEGEVQLLTGLVDVQDDACVYDLENEEVRKGLEKIMAIMAEHPHPDNVVFKSCRMSNNGGTKSESRHEAEAEFEVESEDNEETGKEEEELASSEDGTQIEEISEGGHDEKGKAQLLFEEPVAGELAQAIISEGAAAADKRPGSFERFIADHKGSEVANDLDVSDMPGLSSITLDRERLDSPETAKKSQYAATVENVSDEEDGGLARRFKEHAKTARRFTRRTTGFKRER